MLVDLTKILQDENGNDIKVFEKDENGKTIKGSEKELSVFQVVRASLLLRKKDMTKQEQAKNFSLWREIKDMEDFEFSADECKRIPVLVNQIYTPLIWGQIVELFDPAILKR